MSRQNRGSDSELSYASPIFVTTKETGKDIVAHERDRRSRGSSDDDEDIEYPENFLNEDFRAGGPCLVPSPAGGYVMPSGERLNSLNQGDHWESISNILSEFKIDVEEHGTGMRYPKRQPNETVPTLQVIAQKTQLDQTWIQATLKIRSYLLENNFPEVSIEIADKRAFRETFCSPVERTNAIHPMWDKVCNKILAEVDWEHLNIVECFRMGYSENPMENPPAVVVTVDGDSERKWKPTREKIMEILKEFNLLEVAVIILKGQALRAGDGRNVSIPSAAWGDKAKLGVSMGPNHNRTGSATFGGFIELLNKDGQWHRFGLTCYHAVLPHQGDQDEDGSDSEMSKLAEKWHLWGVHVHDKEARHRLRPMQPSENDTISQLNHANEEITNIRGDPSFQDGERRAARGHLVGQDMTVQLQNKKAIIELESSKTKINRFCSNGRATLGRVFVASGYCTRRAKSHPGHIQLDWALIKMACSRQGNNSVSFNFHIWYEYALTSRGSTLMERRDMISRTPSFALP